MARLALLAPCFAACLATQPPPPGVAVSLGRPQAGILRGGRALPPRGTGFVRVREADHAFGSDALLGLVERAAARWSREVPGPPLRVGDLSRASGGELSGHESHRSGRDVDILYPMADASGTPRAGLGGFPIGLSGFGIQGGHLYRLDVVRTWAFFRALLEDRETDVQWIFISHGVKAVLLEHALRTGEDPTLVERAAWVLHQPTNGRPHDDHFHLRAYCGALDRAYGCVDGAPLWPWLEKSRDAGGASGATDEALWAALAAPLPTRDPVATAPR